MATKRFAKRSAFMLSSMQVEMLDALAARDGVTTSDVIRRLITDSYRQTFGLAINHLANKHRKLAEQAATHAAKPAKVTKKARKTT